MNEEKIKIVEGKLEYTNNIEFNEGEWSFYNFDPQIVIKFDSPVIGVRLEAKLNSISDHMYNTSVYFGDEDCGFAQDKVINYKRKYKTISNKTDVLFNDYYTNVRIDLDDDNSKIYLDSFLIEPLYSMPDATKQFRNILSPKKHKEGFVLFTHDLSNTGAPILALNIAKNLMKKSNDLVVVSCNSMNNELSKSYLQENIPLYFFDDFSESEYFIANESVQYNYYDNQHFFLEALRDLGYKKAIVNSVASGDAVRRLKEYDFKVITLIHEMKNTITHHFFNKGRDISQYSDYLVFPDKIVKKDFESIFEDICGKVFIFPQGVYLKKDFDNIAVENDSINKILKNLKGKKLIMGSGTAELRKGIDLFVSAAISLLNMEDNFEFIWTGSFADPDLEGWLSNQIEKAGFSNKIHIIPFVTNKNDYKLLLSRVSAFWLTSREDPFPSVALEAMHFNIPVFGFKDSGGFNTMSEENRAICIDSFDVGQLASNTLNYFTKSVSIDKTNIEKFIKSLNFSEYVEKIIRILNESEIIQPELNLYETFKSQVIESKNCKINKQNLNQKMDAISKAKFKRNKVNDSTVVLLDTESGSEYIENAIIMSDCEKTCHNVLKGKNLVHVPAHIYDEQSEHMQDKLKILCGADVLQRKMETSNQLVLPHDMSNMKNVCLLGVGLNELGLDTEPSEYTIRLLKLMLKNNYVHSVTNQQTKLFLERIGIKNVVNTSYPALWDLSLEHCKQIDSKKSNNALTSITHNKMDQENDLYVLKTLKKEYQKVYVWIQELSDYEYLKQIVNTKEYVIISPTLENLDNILELEDLDYIGSCLQIAFRSLKKYHRSIIISADNETLEIMKDVNIPSIGQFELEENLVKMIYSNLDIRIKLPINEINLWKNQFNHK